MYMAHYTFESLESMFNGSPGNIHMLLVWKPANNQKRISKCETDTSDKTDRQTDRQADDRQTDRTDRQADDRQTDRQTDRQADNRQKDRPSGRGLSTMISNKSSSFNT